MNIRKSTIIWSLVLIIFTCNVDVDAKAAKASRRGGGQKKAPNYDHVALSYGSHGKNTHHQPAPHQQQHQAHQVHQTHSHQPHAPSAPALPSTNNNNNKPPVGWNVPHTDTVNQQKTVSNTQSALPYPQNPPPYQQHTGFSSHPAPAGPPPPYSANPAFNSHPAGPPPAYSQTPNTGFNSHVPAGQPPAYQPAPSYPVHNAPNAAYPQQTYNPSPVGGYPGGATSFVPSGQQAPVINNYYGQPQSGGSSGGGSSFLGTALAAGAGAAAGSALYGALKPDSEQKTIIIHENNNAAPASVTPAPAIPVDTSGATAAVQPSTGDHSSVPQSSQPSPQAPLDTGVRSGLSSDSPPLAPVVPLAPLSDPSVAQPNLSMAPMPESTTLQASPSVTNAAIPETSATQNQTVAPSTSTSSSVPLAPFPDSSAQAQKGSANTFVIFNVSVYTVMSILLASVF